jgi:hypothetical protein
MGIMQPGNDQGNTAFYTDLSGMQTFTADQKPVVQKRCSQLNPAKK